MFGFLNTAALFAASAALIPLIIHLFSKRKVRIVEFSSLKHLKAMQRREVRRLKIRQLLLLLVRMLIILSVVLAFARPTTESGGVGAHASVSAVILLDNSASMNRLAADGNLFDLAKARTEELLATFGSADEVCLIALNSEQAAAQSTKFVPPAVALQQLSQVKARGGSADIGISWENAVELLESASNLNKEIYILSDHQRSSLPGEEISVETEVAVYPVSLPVPENDNLGIVSLDFGGQLIRPGHDFDLVATVKNYGSRVVTEGIASLFINNLRVAQTDFQVDGSGEAKVRFTRSLGRTGFHSGYVQIGDDLFDFDNRYYFSVRMPERFNLLIIDSDPSSAFLELALIPDQAISRFWSVKKVSPGQLAGIDYNDYDIVVMSGVPDLPAGHFERLKSFVHNGKSLFVIYAAGMDIDVFNERWTEITGLRFDRPAPAQFSQSGFYTLDAIDMQHPIFSVFNFEQSRPPEIKFYSLPQVTITDDAQTLISFSGNHPALVEYHYGSGRTLTLTGPLDPGYSEMTSHAFFVPLVSRIAEYLASDLSLLEVKHYCQAPIVRHLPPEIATDYQFTLITPDSSRFLLPPEEQHGSLIIRPTPLDQPGIYTIELLGHKLDQLAINVDPAECDLASVETEELLKALHVKSDRLIEPSDDIETMLASFRFGRELWPIFLWLAVSLLVAEMFLARGQASEDKDDA
ncbi:MAG: BatA domain-containing protein [candidate division Zixibacteria bacterium]